MGRVGSRAATARDVALFRYSLVRPLADPALGAAVRGALVRELAGQQHVGPAGDLVTVSRSTLDRWIRQWLFRHGEDVWGNVVRRLPGAGGQPRLRALSVSR